jgi:hypothetical protein
MKKDEPKGTSQYDKSTFYWAVTYQANKRCKPHIVRIYPRGNDARQYALSSNRHFKEQGFGDWHFAVKRFMFYFKGTEIDAYEHEWQRVEMRKTRLPA